MTEANSTFEGIGGWATVIAAVFFALSCVLAFVLFRRSKPSKTVDWVPRGLASVVRAPVSDVSSGLKLTWNDEVLRTPYSVKLRIQNTGSAAVAASDFMKAPTFDFGGSKCYEITVSAVSNPDIMPLGEIATDTVPRSEFGVTSPALNAGDWFELTMIADGKISYPNVTARVFGETRPMADYLSLRTRGPRSVMFLIASIIGIALVPSSILLNVLFGGNTPKNHYQPLTISLLFVGMTLAVGGMMLRANSNLRYNAANWDQISRPPEL